MKHVTLLLAILLSTAAGAAQETIAPRAGIDGDLARLVAFEDRVARVVRRVMPATVGLRIGGAQGSGVIVSEGGLILTAGHVFNRPGDDVTVILADGRKLSGKTAGRNRILDIGLVKLDDAGPHPWTPLGDATHLEPGDLLLALGHPGGFQRGRAPVVRLGRVRSTRGPFLRTDCVINVGDSGGPLFDLEGRVVGIHSRIRERVTDNYHVRIDDFRENWQRLVAGDDWGLEPRAPEGPLIGIYGQTTELGCEISRVIRGLPAERAGLEPRDVILRFEGERVKGIDDLVGLVQRRRIGDEVRLEVRRGEQTLDVTVRLTAGK